MSRNLFVLLFFIILSSIVGLFFFDFNPTGSSSIYLFLQLFAMIVVQGIRRKTLGLTFLPSFARFSKQRANEFALMFSDETMGK